MGADIAEAAFAYLSFTSFYVSFSHVLTVFTCKSGTFSANSKQKKEVIFHFKR